MAKKAKLIKKADVGAYLEKLDPDKKPIKKKDHFTTARLAVAEKLSKRRSP